MDLIQKMPTHQMSCNISGIRGITIILWIKKNIWNYLSLTYQNCTITIPRSTINEVQSIEHNEVDCELCEITELRVWECETECAVSAGAFSVLRVNFMFIRHTGYFLLQVYVPCMLLVVLSWVSFWLNREATADRISLGLHSLLSPTLSLFFHSLVLQPCLH